MISSAAIVATVSEFCFPAHFSLTLYFFIRVLQHSCLTLQVVNQVGISQLILEIDLFWLSNIFGYSVSIYEYYLSCIYCLHMVVKHYSCEAKPEKVREKGKSNKKIIKRNET